MKILVLGGYGNTGKIICELLLRFTNSEIIIAGRNLNKAENFAKQLAGNYQIERISAISIDASKSDSLKNEFSKSDIIVNASSTIEYIDNILDGVISVKKNYIDTHLSSSEKWDAIRKREKELISNKIIFISDGGYHPGIPAAIIRYAEKQYDKLISANVYACMQIDWGSLSFSEATASEFIGELKDFNPTCFQNKKWIKLPYSKAPKIDFGHPFGIQYCVPMFMEELRSLPSKNSNLEETGFFISGLDKFTNLVTMPLSIMLLKISQKMFKKGLGKLFLFGAQRFSKPPFGVKLFLEAIGIKAGKETKTRYTIFHDNGYILTAVPTVACIMQLISEQINQSGAYCQGLVVEPERFFKDMGTMGVSLEIE